MEGNVFLINIFIKVFHPRHISGHISTYIYIYIRTHVSIVKAFGVTGAHPASSTRRPSTRQVSARPTQPSRADRGLSSGPHQQAPGAWLPVTWVWLECAMSSVNAALIGTNKTCVFGVFNYFNFVVCMGVSDFGAGCSSDSREPTCVGFDCLFDPALWTHLQFRIFSIPTSG